MSKRRRLTIGGVAARVGEVTDIRLKVSETYTGDPVELPLRVIRARRPGPTVFLTAAIHGDEINGTGIIRELIFGRHLHLNAGTLVCVPVVNIFGFETHNRYTPDRRDLNRSFPGSPGGSLASRVANQIFEEIVRKCDFGLDLHSAAVDRTNFPNVRGDFTVPGVRRLAEAFGCEIIANGRGPEGSLRRAACEAGCPTIILEAGGVGKIEPSILEIGMAGVRSVLIDLGMLDGTPRAPVYRATIEENTWVRAELGGLLRFHVAPGDLVEAGQAIATNVSVFGESRSTLISPVDGIVQGMATHPAVKPGEPVCDIAVPRESLASIRRSIASAPDRDLYRRLQEDLGRALFVAEHALPSREPAATPSAEAASPGSEKARPVGRGAGKTRGEAAG